MEAAALAAPDGWPATWRPGASSRTATRPLVQIPRSSCIVLHGVDLKFSLGPRGRHHHHVGFSHTELSKLPKALVGAQFFVGLISNFRLPPGPRSNHPLGAGMEVDVLNLKGLLVTSPIRSRAWIRSKANRLCARPSGPPQSTGGRTTKPATAPLRGAVSRFRL
jgi:hypothetical protein